MSLVTAVAPRDCRGRDDAIARIEGSQKQPTQSC